MEENKMPLKEILIKVQGNSYTLKWPSVGQIIDIETRKAALSAGQYTRLAETGTISSFLAKNYIDIIAVFTILLPQILKDLRKENLFDLDMQEMVELTEIYKTQYLPWYNEWLLIITKENNQDNKTE